MALNNFDGTNDVPAKERIIYYGFDSPRILPFTLLNIAKKRYSSTDPQIFKTKTITAFCSKCPSYT